LIGRGLSLFLYVVGLQASGQEDSPDALLDLLKAELDQHYEMLSLQDPPVYHLGYTVSDTAAMRIAANGGFLGDSRQQRRRIVDVDMRLGSMLMDNHRAQPGVWRTNKHFSAPLPLDGDSLATERILWRLTDDSYREGSDQLARIQAERQVAAETMDQSADFSQAPRLELLQEIQIPQWEQARLEEVARELSSAFLQWPELLSSGVQLDLEFQTRHQVSSEGSKIRTATQRVRVSFFASIRVEDGSEITLYDAAEAGSLDRLPDSSELTKNIEALVEKLMDLKQAPLMEPYNGPAILGGRAAGVFFHEVFGHRIEGHRQKDEEEGQTFGSKVGLPILPEFLTVIDDPTQLQRDGKDLSGAYEVDDEGVLSERVVLVEEGVLKSFLMSRSPVEGFERSNGHGRREAGQSSVSRQGNLMVFAEGGLEKDALRKALLKEVAAQGLDFGLLVESIQGGFTQTGRSAPNSFQVTPDYAWKVYADGRPDVLVRGVDLIGTPLMAFERILAAGVDVAVFNGRCGAESGWVPVSASSPSLLLGEVEFQKKEKGHRLPPILPPPNLSEGQ